MKATFATNSPLYSRASLFTCSKMVDEKKEKLFGPLALSALLLNGQIDGRVQ